MFKGRPVFPGIAEGRIRIWNRKQKLVPRRPGDPEKELLRLSEAGRAAEGELIRMAEEAAGWGGREAGEIFSACRLLFSDPAYMGRIQDMIRREQVSAEYGVFSVSEALFQEFCSMEEEYLRVRSADIRDAELRLLRLLGDEAEGEVSPGPCILFAEELLPGDLLKLSPKDLLAVVTRQGSSLSHAAILARTMGIPAVTGIALPQEAEGRLAAVEGDAGLVWLEPDQEKLSRLRKKQAESAREAEELLALKDLPAVSKSGRRIRLYANIGGLSDLKEALSRGAEGVGLFRTEFLYLGRTAPPGEEEQFQIYRAAAEALRGKPLILRTFDIGADKQVSYLQQEREENPAMGYRGIRIGLDRPELLKPQLRAALRAGLYGNLSIMYPMITSIRELSGLRRLLREAEEELLQEGIPFRKGIRQGVMIETPAAAVTADLLIREADFFSIGTNDLTQYTYAADRQNHRLAGCGDPSREALLRLIRYTVKAAHKAGKEAAVCGELAADRSLTGFFLELGIDELSVSPGMLLPLRKGIREEA